MTLNCVDQKEGWQELSRDEMKPFRDSHPSLLLLLSLLSRRSQLRMIFGI